MQVEQGVAHCRPEPQECCQAENNRLGCGEQPVGMIGDRGQGQQMQH
jgi:hypothetical protein